MNKFIISSLVCFLFIGSLYSCKHDPTGRLLTLDEQAVVTDVVHDWQEDTPSDAWNEECEKAPSLLRLKVVGADELMSYCWRCPPGLCPQGPTKECPYGCAYGCIVNDTIISYETTPVCPLLVHETTHWLGECLYNNSDAAHNIDVWWLRQEEESEMYCGSLDEQ